MIRWLCITIVTIFVKLFYRHKVYGEENIPEGAAIIAPNHASYLDPPLVGISSPHHVIHFLGRASLFESKFWGWLIRRLHTHPIKRGQENVAAFKLSLQLLGEGKKIVIFPEGERTYDGKLQHGQQGVGMLVMRAGCQVVPVYVHGTFDIWPRKQSKPSLKGRTACVYGKPLDFSQLEAPSKKELQQKIVDQIMEKIAELRDWYIAGAEGEMPSQSPKETGSTGR